MNKHRNRRHLQRHPAFAKTILALLLAGSAGAQAQTWTGSGLTNNWNDPFNWAGFVPPISGPATSITFAGIARLTPMQNLASPFQLNALTFANGAGAFVLNGNALRFAGAISSLSQNSNSAITINNALQIDGNLIYGGTGSATLAGTLSRSGLNTAANTFLTKTGGGTLTLSGTNSYDGVVAINAGQVRLGQALALQNGTVAIGVNDGLNLNGLASATLGNLSGTGSLALGATQLTVGGNNQSPAAYAGTITGTTGSLTKVGTGTTTFSGAGSSFDNLLVRQGRLALSGGSLILNNSGQGLMVGNNLAGPSGGPTLDVVDGAIVSSAGTTVQVDGANGTTLNILGANSRLTTGFQTLVGNHATGTLNVGSGGVLQAGAFLLIGFDSGGNGALKVAAGGTVNGTVGLVGGLTGSTGTANVTGAGASWINSSLGLGGFSSTLRGGTGTLTVGNGGQVLVANDVTFWTAGSSIVVNGGSLLAGRLASDGALGTINLQADPGGGPALTINAASGTSTYAGTITGNGRLAKSGASLQTLAGANTFSGTTTITGGQIVLGHALALQNSTAVIGVNGGLNLNGLASATLGNLSGTGSLALGTTQLTIGGNNQSPAAYSGAITGTTGSLTKVGTGTTTLSGAGSVFDNLLVQQGRMHLSGGSMTLTDAGQGLMLGSNVGGTSGGPILAVFNGAVVSALGTTVQVDGAADTRLDVLGPGSRLATGFQTLVGNHARGSLGVADGGTLEAGGFLAMGFNAGSIGTLNILSGGTATSTIGLLGTLAGATGTANVAGTDARWTTAGLGLGGFSAAQRGGNGTLNIGNGGQVSVSGESKLWTAGSKITVNGGSFATGRLNSDGAVGTIDLITDPTGGAALTVNGASASTFAGTITGGGGLAKSGASELTLSGINTFSGATTINGGQIVLGQALALQNSTAVIGVNGGLNLNGLGSVTLGNLSGTGSLALGTTQLTVGQNNQSPAAYSGAITGTTGSLTKVGNGITTLSGTGSSFRNLRVSSGALDVTGGSLTLTSETTDGNSAVIVGGGAALNITGGTKVNANGPGHSSVFIDGVAGTNLLIDGPGTAFNVGFQTIVGNTNRGGLTIRNAGQLTGRFALVAGLTNGSAGTLTIESGGVASADTVVVGTLAGSTGNATVTGEGSRLDATSTLGIGGLDAGQKGGTGTLTIANAGTVAAGTTTFWTAGSTINIDGGSLLTGALASDGAVGTIHLIANSLNGAALTINGTSGTSAFGGTITGRGGLTKSGASVQTLASANTFSGTTTITGGQIVLGHALALQNSTVLLDVNDGLNLNGHASVTLGNLSGTGSLNLGATQLTVGNNNLSPPAYGGTMTGTTGSFIKAGTGTTTLAGTGSSLRNLRVDGGTLNAVGGSLTLTSETSDGNSAIIVGSGATMRIAGGAIVNADGPNRSSVFIDGTAGTNLVVDGLGSQLNVGFQLVAGNFASGALTIRNSGRVTSNDILAIGFVNNSLGTLTIESGGVASAPAFSIGTLAGSNGVATVTGAGSRLDANTLGLGRLNISQYGGTGTLTIKDAGAVNTSVTTLSTAGSKIVIDGGRLVAGSLISDGAVGSIDLANDPLGITALGINGASGSSTYSGTISGAGSLFKTGGSTQQLLGANTFTGTVTVRGGLLEMTSSAASYYEVGTGGSLRLGERSLGFAVVQAAPGGTVTYTNTILSGGTLLGGGTHDITAVNRMIGTSVGNGVALTPKNGAAFIGVSNSGDITNAAGRNLSWTGGSNTVGTLTVAGVTTVNGWSSGGVVNVESGGRLLNTSGNLVFSGGSRTYVGSVAAPGGTISLRNGTRMQLNGALLVNNGTIAGPVDVNFGSLAKGAGVYGTVNVTDGGKFSPGNSPGNTVSGDVTWGAGGTYLVELAAALGTAGTHWDLWTINGTLDITAGTTSNSRFTISLATLNGSDQAAPLSGFNNQQPYRWQIVDTTGGVVGFDAAKFALDTTGFVNGLAGGHFELALSGGDVFVDFVAAPVPEPHEWALMLAGLGCVAGMARRRRRQTASTG